MAANKKKATARHTEDTPVKSFLDMIAPSVVQFNPDHFICGNTFRCVWALREYPTQTDEQALLRHLGEKDGITLRIYTRQLTPAEEKRIIQNAANKNRMGSSNTNDLQQTITAESNLQDMISMEGSRHRNKEPLFHCAVYIELTASDHNTLKLLQTDVLTELVRSKLNVDRLLLRQQQGFCCASPVGYNAFGAQFERVLPASSVANLYPFNYSGKTDAKGFYVGRDKYGSNILVDFDQRDEDKTSANILILGNSGQGKSYLMKLLILNLLESGKSIITLDAEHEQQEMCEAVGGCFADLMAGQYIINVLEPKCWDDGGDPDDTAAPEAFRKNTLLAQHISFLKDFFRAYKDFSDAHIDTIEIMLSKLYQKWGITERTNFRRMRSKDYPILSDLYDLIEAEYKSYDMAAHQLYTEQILREVLLGLHSMCKGADAQFFNMRTAFSLLDSAVASVNGRTEGGNSLDPIRVKAVFYALCFGEEAPGRRAANRFVECFYTWETRTRTVNVENEDGTVTSTEEEYTVAVPVSLYQAYANLEAELGRTITEDDKNNINHIYTMIAGTAGGGSYSGEFLRGDGSSIDLDISTFTDPNSKNAADLVTYAIHAWESGWGYVWGTYGNVLTESLLAYKVSQYPDGVGNHEDIIRANWLGGRTADCVGLIKGYGWLSPETMTIDYGTHGMPDIGANQMYYNATESGAIDTMPDIPGLAVWHDGHIGVYIGGGQVVEAMGTKYGVVKTELAGRGWTHWLKIPYINYD